MFKKYLLFFLTLFVVIIASADNRKYRIDFIVFKYLNPDVGNEIFSGKASVINTDKSHTNFIENSLSSSLKKEIKKIESDKSLALILSGSFTDKSMPFNTTIYGGSLYGFDHQINGSINIKKAANVFDVDLNIVLTEPIKNFNNISDNILNKSDLFSVDIKQRQRARDGELCYFDNPLFGVLLKISSF